MRNKITLQSWYLLIIGALLCFFNAPGPTMVMARIEKEEEAEMIQKEIQGDRSDGQDDLSSPMSKSSSRHHGSRKETKEHLPKVQPWYQETGLFPRIQKGLVVLNDGMFIFKSLFTPTLFSYLV